MEWIRSFWTERCFVYGILRASEGYEDCKKLGFIAHMDTVSEFCEEEIVPVVTKQYNGGRSYSSEMWKNIEC